MPAARTDGENMDQSEAAYVDSQYEYLQKHKSEGITLEELKRRFSKPFSQNTSCRAPSLPPSGP